MKDKALVQYEMSLSVCAYDHDFEACQADIPAVRAKLDALLVEMMGEDQRESWEIGTIIFEEFDASRSAVHAHAIFLCDVLVNLNDFFWSAMMRLENEID